jgi:Ca2+-binding RTX toxin-like protein
MRLLCLLAAAAISLLCAPAAFGATVSVHDEPQKLDVVAGAGEVNDITVSQDGASLVVTDAGPNIIPGPGCQGRPAGGVRCAVVADKPFKILHVDLGDEDDHLTVATPLGADVDAGAGNDAVLGGAGDDSLHGDAGDDRLEGGAGKDSYDGGEGSDVLMARDALAEEILCGGGSDTGEADIEDTVAAECEGIVKPLAPPTVADDVPAPTPTVGPAGEVTAPILGRTVAVGVKRGVIKVRHPGTNGFVPLDPTQPVPVGSVLDAKHGTLSLTATRDASGATQSADFTGGRFEVRQVPGRVLTTELRMRAGNFSVCGTASSSRAAAHAAADKRKRTVRKLWGSGHGRFKTRGRNSAATVRGTIWTVIDRCDGTLTKVTRGVVLVHDFTRGRTKVVRAGQSYFAPRKRASR